MPCPDNGVYIVIGEMNMVMAAMKRGSRWSSHIHQEEEQGSLMSNFCELKETLNHLNSLNEIEPTVYLSPFLDVIRSENTTGPVTGLALSSISKFLSYGLIDAKSTTAPAAAENIADAVTHARFMGTDPASDEVVLMKILQVLRLLLLTPLGVLLNNESVCEIMQSCFRICFETRLSELLRRSAEHALMDMVQLLFSCLPQFTEDSRCLYNKKLKMRASGMDTTRNTRKKRASKSKHSKGSNNPSDGEQISGLLTPPSSIVTSPEPSTVSAANSPTDANSIDGQQLEANTSQTSIDMSSIDETVRTSELPESVLPESQTDVEQSNLKPSNSESSLEASTESLTNTQSQSEKCTVDQRNSFVQTSQPYTLDLNCMRRNSDNSDRSFTPGIECNGQTKSPEAVDANSEAGSITMENPEEIASVIDNSETDYVNPRGVRFTPHQPLKDGSGPLLPYGLPCVRELFRFLVSLINPLDRHNSEVMIHIGLSLLTVALEAGADHIGKFNSLLLLIKDETCRNLFSLLSTERLTIFAAALRVYFLLFEALRTHLKFQLEMVLSHLMEVIISESPKFSYEQKEISLDCITQLWRIPGLVTELYINYDCDLYCSNLYEDLTKMLSKNAFPLSGLYSVHVLSLDALLAVIQTIETHCQYRMLNESQYQNKQDVLNATDFVVPENGLDDVRTCVLQQGASGYLLGQHLLSVDFAESKLCSEDTSDKQKPHIQPNRMKVSLSIPSHEELMAIKHKKKILASGTEHFNNQPSKGIIFLQEHGLLKDPLDPQEVAAFLRDNPQLDKKMIGEYISNRKNLKVLEAFVRSFAFEDTRIDEALRQYLETFRLPGEAPLISLLLEHFAEHWHKSNNEPFANSDAAFTLAYAIIMLNVDQHNHNVRKQSTPMKVEDFKKNLKNVNGGQNFDDEMLEEIYASINNEEIVMPAEQTGLVKENYLWKVLLRRGSSKEGKFIHTPNGLFDHDLFSLIWGPTVAALSFIFDKSSESSIIEKAISGFHRCAMIAAHYGMSDVFDNLVISLCKFTCLVNSTEAPSHLPVSFGSNAKAHMATKAVFRLAHRHGDILREGWKNLLDCVLQLYKAKLLPSELVEAEDFINPKGVISLIREDVSTIPRMESGLLSSFYSYITLTADSTSQRGPTQEDEAAKQAAMDCILNCHCEHLFTESKFLRIDSLQELVKTLIYACHGPESPVSIGGTYDEDSAVFLLELLVKIVLLNRDRVTSIWSGIRDHLFSLVMGAAASDHYYLLERGVVGILRIAIRLVRKEEMIPQVLQSLRILLFLKSPALSYVSRQVAYASHELLRTNAANIHSSEDWSIIFSLMECVGAGAKPPRVVSGINSEFVDTGAQSDSELSTGRHIQDSGLGSDRGYTSDSELYDSQAGSPRHQRVPENVNKDGDIETVQVRPLPVNQFNIVLQQELTSHDSHAFLKCCESLAFLVRDAAHITPENFESCVHCIRTFVEASVNGGHSADKKISKSKVNKEKKWAKGLQRKKDEKAKKLRSVSSKVGEGYDADDEDKVDELSPAYQQVSMQLLDLMHTLHTRASSIWGASERSMVEDSGYPDLSLWSSCWCPLLQGIARLCCDARRAIRTSALTFLQRALLVHDLQALTPAEWEACFNKVLFPLLAKLLENINPSDPIGMEETRMRGATLLCKVFLQHLSPLLTLPTFMALWLTILDFMDKYMHADGSDLLNEAIPESLKNMLLVMDTAGIFQRPDETNCVEDCQMWHITWDRINAFLPKLQEEVFKPAAVVPSQSPTPATAVPPVEEKPPCIPSPSSTVTESDDSKGSDTTENCQAVISDATPVGYPACTAPLPCVSAPDSTSLSPSVSVILHPPASPLVYSPVSAPTISSHALSTPSVPLLLNPSVMSQAHMPIFSPQASGCNISHSLR